MPVYKKMQHLFLKFVNEVGTKCCLLPSKTENFEKPDSCPFLLRLYFWKKGFNHSENDFCT